MSLAPAEVHARDFEGARHVHVEGYVVFNQALADAFLDAARSAGATVGLSLASFEVVAAARDWLLKQFKRGLALTFANEDEAKALFPDLPAQGPDDYAAHAKRLAEFGGTVAVTLGKDGAWIARGKELHRIAPLAVADASDAWAAGFLYGHLKDWPLPAAGALASLVGAETVRHLGPIIPDSHWPEVHRRGLQHAPKR
jgi:sugar/nucleoside kinase (ribokinase family)